MRKNKVKAALRAGKTVIGSEASRIRTTELPRIFAAAGCDFIFIDMEHTAFNLETVADMVQMARLVDIVPIVRVPDTEHHFIARALDIGAQGIMVPRVSTPQQVQKIVNWIRYPPIGVRGMAITPSQTEYETVTARDFIDGMERETLLVIQIERREALDNLDEMLAIPGVDVAALGHMDLSVDLGVPGEIDHPSMKRSIESVVDACQRHGVSAGMISPDFKYVSYWAGRGVRFLSYCTGAGILLQAASAAVRQLREECKNHSTL